MPQSQIGLNLVQGWTTRPFLPGLVNFVPAVDYHFCFNLNAVFLQPGSGLIVPALYEAISEAIFPLPALNTAHFTT